MFRKSGKMITHRVIVVAGAFGTIGRATCLELEREGAVVVRVGRSVPRGRHDTPDGGRVGPELAADLSRLAEWDRIVDLVLGLHGRIDAMVHCAGVLIPGGVRTLSEEGTMRMLADNVLSVIHGCRAVVAAMEISGGGHLCIVGSSGGIVPMPYCSVYSAGKFAVRGFVLSVAEELRGSGIGISLISCGPVDSPMLEKEALDEDSTIAFAPPPLQPRAVGRAVVDALRHPRTEIFLPARGSLVTRLAGMSQRTYRLLYPIARAIGASRKSRYRIPRPGQSTPHVTTGGRVR